MIDNLSIKHHLATLFPNYLTMIRKLYPWYKVDGKGPAITIEAIGQEPDYKVTINDPQLGDMLLLRLKKYPKCCGMYMLYDFAIESKYFQNIPAFHKFMDDILFSLSGVWWKNRRLEVNMVESRTPDQLGFHGETVEDGELTEEYIEWYSTQRFIDIKPIANPTIEYEMFWDYFHTKWTRDRLMYNVNSHNIIHNLEVIL